MARFAEARRMQQGPKLEHERRSRPVRAHTIAASVAGVDPAELARIAGKEVGEEPPDPETNLRLWRTLVRHSGNEALALHAAEAVPFGAFEILD
ncbi:MAG: hypothetical protein KUG77_01445 [Nannocystaceae bacterium]|nr:hypothetical protein [Nannocystaceae bacterium]